MTSLLARLQYSYFPILHLTSFRRHLRISISVTLMNLICIHCSFAKSTVVDHLLRMLINFAVTLPTQCDISITLGHYPTTFQGLSRVTQ
jgi:hypothetical protein